MKLLEVVNVNQTTNSQVIPRHVNHVIQVHTNLTLEIKNVQGVWIILPLLKINVHANQVMLVLLTILKKLVQCVMVSRNIYVNDIPTNLR